MRALCAIVFVAAAAASYLAWGYLATGRPVSEPTEFLSGPQVGEKLPGPFEPLNVNGPDAGDEACLYCKYGNAPVVMIFASKPTDELASLVHHVEKAAADAAKGGEVGACVVVTDASPTTRATLTKLADKENLKQVLLGTIDFKKMKKYSLHPDAEVTVLLYSKLVVRANHAYKAGELNEKVVAELTEETAKFFATK